MDAFTERTTWIAVAILTTIIAVVQGIAGNLLTDPVRRRLNALQDWYARSSRTRAERRIAALMQHLETITRFREEPQLFLVRSVRHIYMVAGNLILLGMYGLVITLASAE